MGEEGIIASERAPLIYPTYKPQNSTNHKVSYPLVHFDTEISFQDPILIYIVFGKYCGPHYKWGDWYEIHRKYHCGCTLYSNPQCITSEVYVVGYRVLLLDNNKVGLRDPYLSYLRSFHLRFKYSTLFLEIETNKIEIVSSLHIIVTLCISPIEATQIGRVCGKVDAKTIPSIAHYFHAWWCIIWGHIVVHWRVSYIIKIPIICTIECVVQVIWDESTTNLQGCVVFRRER